jgi:hypothetical protein
VISYTKDLDKNIFLRRRITRGKKFDIGHYNTPFKNTNKAIFSKINIEFG